MQLVLLIILEPTAFFWVKRRRAKSILVGRINDLLAGLASTICNNIEPTTHSTRLPGLPLIPLNAQEKNRFNVLLSLFNVKLFAGAAVANHGPMGRYCFGIRRAGKGIACKGRPRGRQIWVPSRAPPSPSTSEGYSATDQTYPAQKDTYIYTYIYIYMYIWALWAEGRRQGVAASIFFNIFCLVQKSVAAGAFDLPFLLK